jgi:hypothetical protein
LENRVALNIAQILHNMIGPAMLMLFGACAKYLRDISRDVNSMKVTMSVTSERLNTHSHRLAAHDDRIRELESVQNSRYVS